ncbi:MAG: DUF6580 family putative transport protein [Pseudomonadota bacterium]
MTLSYKLNNHHLVLILILAAALIRWLPHPDNFTPIGALALFAGAYIDRRVFWLVPLVALFLGDLINGLYDLLVMGFVYLGLFASTWLGRQIIYGRDSVTRIMMGVGAGSISFWLISNFGAFLAFRPISIDGLVSCYIDAIPYFTRSLTGDALYAVVLFGGYFLLRSTLKLKTT